MLGHTLVTASVDLVYRFRLLATYTSPERVQMKRQTCKPRSPWVFICVFLRYSAACRPTRTRRTAEPPNRVRLERVSGGRGRSFRWVACVFFFKTPRLFSSRLFLLQEGRPSGQQERSRGFWEERLIGQLDHQGASQPRGVSRP